MLLVFQIPAPMRHCALGKFEQHVGACYLHLLLRSVSSPDLVEYKSKWPPVAMTGTSSSVDPQNCKRLSLSELL